MLYIVNSGIELHTKQFTEKMTNGNGHNGKELKNNSMKLEEITLKELIEKYKKRPRRNVLNPSFTSPTSLPLYFYIGYQLLEESNQWHECGHVC